MSQQTLAERLRDSPNGLRNIALALIVLAAILVMAAMFGRPA